VNHLKTTQLKSGKSFEPNHHVNLQGCYLSGETILFGEKIWKKQQSPDVPGVFFAL